MFNIAFRMMNNREEAEDMLQDSFSDAFARLRSFRFESSFGSWLKRIVINNCLTQPDIFPFPIKSKFTQAKYLNSNSILPPSKFSVSQTTIFINSICLNIRLNKPERLNYFNQMPGLISL